MPAFLVFGKNRTEEVRVCRFSLLSAVLNRVTDIAPPLLHTLGAESPSAGCGQYTCA